MDQVEKEEETPRLAVVTGAGRGLGRALVQVLLEKGWDVLAAVRTPPPQGEGYPSGEAATAVTVLGDLTEADTVRALASRVQKTGRPVDLLIHNAAQLGPRTPLGEVSDEDWDAVLAVNVTAPFRLTRALLPWMRRPGGMVLCLSSGVGVVGRARWGPYAVSKFALEGFAQVLADELSEEGIRVHAADPGGTATRMRAEAYPAEDPRTLPEAMTVARALLSVWDEDPPLLTGARFRARDRMKS